MPLDLIPDCTFIGPALPEPFVRFELEAALTKAGLLSKTTGNDGRTLQESWESYRRKLRELVGSGGPERVRNHVFEPLVARLTYARIEDGGTVETREGREDGGHLLVTEDGTGKLRVWATSLDGDLDAPSRRGAAFRYSAARIAQRVLLACGERVGLLTNGSELRVLISDPARPDSQVIIPIDPNWKRSRNVPDSYRLLLALARPEGVRFLPDLVDQARLQQARVTKDLRRQAREAVELFVQEVLDHSENRTALAQHADQAALARDLWREGLVIIYRLLFVLKLEASDDPARRFSFASSSLWRNSYSPGVALAPFARAVLDQGAETGRLLEDGLRALFRLFAQGLESSELTVKPLTGGLFDQNATPILSRLRWGDRGVALLLDRLLWTPRGRGSSARERVHYGPLDVEDLGRVYEALLELEPGIAAEPMCRLRRQKLEVVVPIAQGEKYRAQKPVANSQNGAEDSEEADDTVDEGEEDEAPSRGKKTKVEWIEEIRPGRFYLRVGLGRKATGSYYTPHSFVRFLVQETLGPQVAERSPDDDPRPDRILALKVLDPATGSGHFLVEACRFLGDHLYEACRRCDELASDAERAAERASDDAERTRLQERAVEMRRRVEDLPDPHDELVAYLPSRVTEGDLPGISERKARALCRRLVAVHCLYGVDKNPLAIELAKLSLWIEAHAEGLPLTFLDHRLVVGDSLTGPFFEHLLTFPGSKRPVSDLFNQGLRARFEQALEAALRHVRDLEVSVGATVAEIAAKQAAKARLDRALAPFRLVAAAWAGGVMLSEKGCDDDAYAWLVQCVSETGELPASFDNHKRLLPMIARGLGVTILPENRERKLPIDAIPALPYDLAFPEVFFPSGVLADRGGFNAVLGNPPWDAIQFKSKEFFAAFDIEYLNAPTKRESTEIERRLLTDVNFGSLLEYHKESFEERKRINDILYQYQKVQIDGDLAGRQVDAFRVFMERNAQVLCTDGLTGCVVPSAFHANEGAVGIRRLYLEQMALRCCYSFENRKKLFEIHGSFKFEPIVASRNGPTSEFPCAFYLHDEAWLSPDLSREHSLRYTLSFVRNTSGKYLSLLELRDRVSTSIAQVMFEKGENFGAFCESVGVKLQKQPAALDMAKESYRFEGTASLFQSSEDPRHPEIRTRLINNGYYYLSEGKTFHQYDETWGEVPRYCVAISNLDDNLLWAYAGRFYRLAFRAVASSTNERTSIFCLLSPGTVSGHSVAVERSPEATPTSKALFIQGFCNSFPFDWIVRVMTSSNVTLFVMENTVIVTKGSIQGFLTHSALRLTCNHAGYEPLWREQVGDAWREETQPYSWPVLAGDDARWKVRAAIDAVVADAYGLSREQYEHVLSTFSHKSYPDARKMCLATFDELKEIGLDAFTKKHDPYWDIPLNESLPQPVIELPVLTKDEGRATKGVATQNVIDFGEAVAAREARRPTKKAAEQRERYAVDEIPKTKDKAPATDSLFGVEIKTPAPAAMTPLDRHVVFLARVIQKHRSTKYEKTLGHVKAEKLAHLVEGHLGVDLGRRPIKDAAGPVDFPHLKEVIARGRAIGAFEEIRRQGDREGYLFVPLPGLAKTAGRLQEAFGDAADSADKLIQDLMGLDSHQIEAIATLYAVWNDLLRVGERPTDERIFERFWAWHSSKASFQRGELLTWLAWMRDAKLVPTGKARPTGEK